MKPSTIIYFALMLIPCISICQVSVDDALVTTTEPMKLKRGLSFSSGSLHKVSFGPYKIADIRKGKEHLVGRKNNTHYEIQGKSKGLKRTVSTKSTQPFSLTILEDGGDTIITNMDLITFKGGGHALIEVKSGKAADDENVTSFCQDMVIQTRADSLDWQMRQNTDIDADDIDFPLSFDATLTNGADNILVKGAEDFPVKSRLFKNSTRGIVFLNNKKQVAALELYPETAIWIKNGIPEHHKQVIAAVMISLLSITNSPRL